MDIDEIIAALQDAKEHCIDGRTVPHIELAFAINSEIYTIFPSIDEITYDNNKVHIKMTEV